MEPRETVIKILEDRVNYLPFFNTESKYINVIYRNGKKIQVMVPSY